MTPMTIHYALLPAEADEDPVAVFSVDIDGGSLSTGCVVPDSDPAALGAMAGIICDNMHSEAHYFPGNDRSEARTERRHLYCGTSKSGDTYYPKAAAFDVTFTPDLPFEE